MQRLNLKFPEGATHRARLARITQENAAVKLQTHGKYCKYSREYETGFVLLKAAHSHISVWELLLGQSHWEAIFSWFQCGIG